jgi:hypothetical protein
VTGGAEPVPVPPDSLRRALAEVFARPEYRWVDARLPLHRLATALGHLFSWLGVLERRHPAASHALVIGLAVLVVALLVHLVYVLWSVTRPTVRTPGGTDTIPVAAVDAPEAHRQQADALARAGRFTEALAHRFVAVALELDRRRALTFDESKTPAEYVVEAHLDDASRQSFADLVARLYRHVFGAVPCDEQAYREFATAAATVER